MYLDWNQAAIWAAEMNSTLISYDYAPVIVVGAKMSGPAEIIQFAVSCAPGLNDQMIRDIFEDLVEQHKAGLTRWSTEPPPDQYKKRNGPAPH